MKKNLKATHTLLILALILLPFLSACSSLKFPGVYRIPILQGNIIDKKKVDQLKLGMTKRQVLYVMGTPMISDVFHTDRWDYFYQLRRADKTLRERHFTLFFDGEELVGWEGDYEPNKEPEVEDNYIEDAEQTEG